ncbi:acetyl esterase [Aquimixticola soesokkakensis]|uniref:Acetyl esterase n=1 Tax=Aquimixticola soesokkakensis TaxID=1519096 RepID=A0A1Y5TBI9_9RHOB|nr:alpha/beta hydrolase [Aquimixticola soesokkakensis]SLN60263.1 acetyl esterase [Aquimixticola soesokkakensis]
MTAHSAPPAASVQTVALTPTLNADLFVPTQGIRHPLIVAASGGGWRRGGRADLNHWGAFFARHGIAFASVDYRRSTEGAVFPDNLCDLETGICALHAQAQDLGLDGARIALLGASAGAHLSALAALGDRLPPLRAMACIYGPYDLLKHWQEDIAKSPERSANLTERMLGCGPFDDPLRYHRASPLRQITTARALPVFLSWGLLDPAIDPQQSLDFAQALQQAGFPVRRRVFPDAGHFWFTEDDLADPQTHAAKLSGDLLRFFTRVLA